MYSYSMIKAVIIDVDDTLFMTEQACFDMENEVLGLLGREPQTREVHRNTWGQPLFEAIKTRSPGVDVDSFRKVMQEVLPLWAADGRLDGVTEANLTALDQLIQQGKELYILTSRTHDELKHLLEPDHELAKRINAFYYRDVMEFHKPDPRAFDIVLSGHDLKHSECVYIGDSSSDAAAAKQANMHFIASLESGLRTREDFKSFAVDLFIDRFAQLPEAVAELEKR